jgi:hypothetical protein
MIDGCEYFGATEEGNFVCKKISSIYKEVTKEMCRTICPVGIGKKRCEHLKFTLRKDQSFSAIGVGGRKTEIKFEKAVCTKLEEQIFDIKQCETCLNFRQVIKKEKEEEKEDVSLPLAKDELIQKGIKLLIDGLGKEGASEFIKKMKLTSDISSSGKKEEERPRQEKEINKEEDELSLDKWLPADF